MEHNVNMPAVALAVYLPEQYPRLLATADDSADWDATWEEWHEKAMQTKENLTAMGMNIVEVTIDLDELERYCRENNLPNNSSTRSEYIAKLLQAQQSQQVLSQDQRLNMISADYTPPVDRLLTYGDPRLAGMQDWPNYLELGIGPEHIPDLIRMAQDEALNTADEDSVEVWAPIHAIRTLGQLHAEAAIEPLVALIETQHDDEWIQEELPRVFGLIGPAALPALAAFFADTSRGLYQRAYAANGLVEIAKLHPEHRAESIAPIIQQLESLDTSDDGTTLNGFLISDLIGLKAVETAPVIERAFAADSVDLSIAGDWDDVQVELGLKDRSELPERRRHSPFRRGTTAADVSSQIPARLRVVRGPQPPLKFSGAHNKSKKKKNKKRK